MNVDDLRNLLTQREGLKLDFKREYQLSKIPPPGINQQDWKNLTDGQWDELIKDILALTNGNFGTSEDPGLLVIGAGDDKDLQPDGTRPLFDMRHLSLNSQQIIETVNKACYPPIADIVCEEIDLDGKFIVLITIPPSSVVHETTRKLRTVKGVIDASGQLRTTGQKEYTERTAFIRRGEGIYSATEAERRALATDKSPETFILSSPLLDLEEFIISESEREKVRSVLVLPHGIEKARDILNQRKRLWLIGPSGLWKRYLAISLAMERPGREIYKIPKFVDWSQLAETNVRDSILIFPDALGLIQSESEKIGGEFRPWEKLLANGNIIIASSPEDVFYEAAREARGLEVLSREGTFPLSMESFSYKNKCAIYERLVINSCRSGVINEAQKEWALDLVEFKSRHDSARTAPGKAVSQAQLQHLLQEVWLPVDIERFVIDSLPDARSAEEISDLLRRDADIETRVHSWFGQLDDSTRCFVLSLTLFSGFPNKQIWARHQDIIERLRRLNPGLSISPLGILRQRSHPYVTSDGPIEFVNPRLSRVIVKEVAKTYREYFTEILDLLKKWSIPDLPQSLTDEDRDQLISGTEDTRNAIARMAGEVGKFGLDDISDLLEAWATHRIGRISKTLGIALREVVMDPPSVNQALTLLSEWSSDTTSEDAEYRRWASASALGKIAAIGSRFGTSEQALMLLQRLTDDHSDYVVSAVAHGFRMVGAALPVEPLSGTLTRLAKRNRVFTRQQVARAMDEAASRDAESVLKLLDVWGSSANPNIRWTAIFALLVSRRLSRQERRERLLYLLTAYPKLFTEALSESLKGDDRDYANSVSVFKELGRSSLEERERLVAALAGVYEVHPSQTQQLLDSLSRKGSQSMQRIQSEIHSRIPTIAIRTLLAEPSPERCPYLVRLLKTSPSDFEKVILEALDSPNDGEINWLVLETLAGPSPNAERSALVDVMTVVYQSKPQELQRLLLKVAINSPPIRDLQLAIQLRVPVKAAYTLLTDPAAPSSATREQLAQLLALAPDAFVLSLPLCVEYESLNWPALEILATPAPEGNREELVAALAGAYQEEPAATHKLLSSFERLSLPHVHSLPSDVLSSVPQAALTTLLGDSTISEDERRTHLVELMEQSPLVFVSSLRPPLKNEPMRKTVLSLLSQMWSVKDHRQLLIAALVDSFEHDPKSTQELLRELTTSPVTWARLLQSSVHAKVPLLAIKELLAERRELMASKTSRTGLLTSRSNGLAFKDSLEKALHDENLSSDLRSLLKDLATPSRSGFRRELVAALSEAYRLEPHNTQELLSRLYRRHRWEVGDLQSSIHAGLCETSALTLLTASYVPRREKYQHITRIFKLDVWAFLKGAVRAYFHVAGRVLNSDSSSVSHVLPEFILATGSFLILFVVFLLILISVVSFFLS